MAYLRIDIQRRSIAAMTLAAVIVAFALGAASIGTAVAAPSCPGPTTSDGLMCCAPGATPTGDDTCQLPGGGVAASCPLAQLTSSGTCCPPSSTPQSDGSCQPSNGFASAPGCPLGQLDKSGASCCPSGQTPQADGSCQPTMAQQPATPSGLLSACPAGSSYLFPQDLCVVALTAAACPAGTQPLVSSNISAGCCPAGTQPTLIQQDGTSVCLELKLQNDGTVVQTTLPTVPPTCPPGSSLNTANSGVENTLCTVPQACPPPYSALYGECVRRPEKISQQKGPHIPDLAQTKAPHMCKGGLVPREAFVGDTVCVEPVKNPSQLPPVVELKLPPQGPGVGAGASAGSSGVLQTVPLGPICPPSATLVTLPGTTNVGPGNNPIPGFNPFTGQIQTTGLAICETPASGCAAGTHASGDSGFAPPSATFYCCPNGWRSIKGGQCCPDHKFGRPYDTVCFDGVQPVSYPPMNCPTGSVAWWNGEQVFCDTPASCLSGSILTGTSCCPSNQVSSLGVCCPPDHLPLPGGACKPNPPAQNAGQITPPIQGQLPNPDRCPGGLVRRDAFDGDRVCVTGAVHDQTVADNAAAPSRTLPNGLCVKGYVWRRARPEDHVCVTPDTRAQTQSDNQRAAAQVQQPVREGLVERPNAPIVCALPSVLRDGRCITVRWSRHVPPRVFRPVVVPHRPGRGSVGGTIGHSTTIQRPTRHAPVFHKH